MLVVLIVVTIVLYIVLWEFEHVEMVSACNRPGQTNLTFMQGIEPARRTDQCYQQSEIAVFVCYEATGGENWLSTTQGAGDGSQWWGCR